RSGRRSSVCRTGPQAAWRAATTTTATGRAPGAAAAGRSSRGQLARQPARHGGECGDIGPVGGGERHAVELLEQVAQLPQRRVGTRALDHRQAFGRIERRVRLGYRARQCGPETPDRPGGDGLWLPGGEPPGVGDLTFQWDWTCRPE